MKTVQNDVTEMMLQKELMMLQNDRVKIILYFLYKVIKLMIVAI